ISNLFFLGSEYSDSKFFSCWCLKYSDWKISNRSFWIRAFAVVPFDQGCEFVTKTPVRPYAVGTYYVCLTFSVFQFLHHALRIGMNVRTVLVSAVFTKVRIVRISIQLF